MMANRRKGKTTKRTIKYLATVTDPKLANYILKKADIPLIKAVSNAAYNITEGEVPLTRQKKVLFARHRKFFTALTSRQKPLATKRKIVQKGGFIGALIPVILSTVLGALGSAVFSK